MTDAEAEELASTLWGDDGWVNAAGVEDGVVRPFRVGRLGSKVSGEGLAWELAFLDAGVAPEVVGARLVREWAELRREEDEENVREHGRPVVRSLRQPGDRGRAIACIALRLGMRKRALAQWLNRRHPASP